MLDRAVANVAAPLRAVKANASQAFIGPLLGQTQLQQPLLPARTLIDWSLG